MSRMTAMNEPTDTGVAAADYVVVGTGSAGSVVAERLSADARNQVVVLEAAPNNTDTRCPVPAAVAQLFGSSYDWDYWTEPQPGLTGRRIYWPRGKTLGGSPPLSAMRRLRGFAADVDEWAQLAGPGWAFSRLVKYLKWIENTEGARDADEAVHGPPYISRQRGPRSATAAWLKAARQAGYPLEQPNTPQPNGFSQPVATQRRGARWSVADAYLRPALGRKNLTLLTGATATRVIFEGTRAAGIEFEKDGRRGVVRARREVVLCGGTLNSPQLLMLSGIGDHQQLRRHGIDVVHHSPQVGKNLRDHLVAVFGVDVRNHTLFTADRLAELVNYLIRRRGMHASPAAEASGFVRSRPELALPDLQLVFEPAPVFDKRLGDRYGHAVMFGPILLNPHSSGQILLRSADLTAKPIIDPGYLTDSGGLDRAAMMEGLRMCAKIAEAPALKGLLGSTTRPLDAPDPRQESLAEALNSYSQSIYHPVGTCRMGSDPPSVVTPQLEVRGVHGLHVADASVMPTAIRGQTLAPSLLIGAKAADLIASATPEGHGARTADALTPMPHSHSRFSDTTFPPPHRNE
jgi:choline dehydrogenase